MIQKNERIFIESSNSEFAQGGIFDSMRGVPCSQHQGGKIAAGPEDDGAVGDRPGSGTQTLIKPKPTLSEPSFYKVVLLNDDFTPMDFVVHVLQKFFSKNMEEATQIMLQVHQQGSGVAGIFSHEIAETKVYVVNDYSRKNKHPLKCTMEKTS